MKIKSLLLGSAAASMLAATGAQAADPIVYVEPEPLEYVRICDVYGSGFFYIPGTETCLQIGGHVYYEVRVGGGDFVDNPTVTTVTVAGDPPIVTTTLAGESPWNDTYRKYLEARINFDARSETEWGTLRSYIRVQASGYNDDRALGAVGNGGISAGGDFDARFDQAFISLGGLTMGYTESVFGTGLRAIGGTHSLNGGFDVAGAPHSGSASYGYAQRMQITYNFAANGFIGAISLEDDANSDGSTLAGEDFSNNYMPDIVGRLGFQQAWGGIYGNVGYDESQDEFAVRVGGELGVGTAGNLRVYGMYSSGVNSFWNQADWSVTGSYQHNFSPAFFAHVGATYWQDVRLPAGGNAYGVEAGIGWNVAQGFLIRAEGQYVSFDSATVVTTPVAGTTVSTFSGGDAYSGRVRFIRTF